MGKIYLGKLIMTKLVKTILAPKKGNNKSKNKKSIPNLAALKKD